MATRTTVRAVQSSISTSLTENQILAFVKDASLWVDEELAGQGLSVDRLELIERYLTCALVRLRDLGLKSATLDWISESYQVDPTVSDYLLRAASFDRTGTIRRTFMAPAAPPRTAVALVGRGFVGDPDPPGRSLL